jgi:hypothetical protein
MELDKGIDYCQEPGFPIVSWQTLCELSTAETQSSQRGLKLFVFDFKNRVKSIDL